MTSANEPMAGDFSLVRGGAMYRLWQAAGLLRPTAPAAAARVAAICLLAWVPLAVLSSIAGSALGGPLPFLTDLEVHARLLVALPCLLAAELTVDDHLRAVVDQLLSRRIVSAVDQPRLDAAIKATARIRDSRFLEPALVLVVYSFGHWLWRTQIALGGTTWYATPGGTGSRLTPAGVWLAFACLPLYHFVVLRWLLRLALWWRFLWRVSRLELNLLPIHPDHAAGLGFLGYRAPFAFAPLLFGQGALAAGFIGSRIVNGGAHLPDFSLLAACWVLLLVALTLAPLVLFAPHLVRTWLRGRREYGQVLTGQIRRFEARWLHPVGLPAPLGNDDAQLLTDLSHDYRAVQSMRFTPVSARNFLATAALVVAPMLPLALSMVPVRAIVAHVLKLVF